MLLTIDVGNTNIVFAVFDGEQLVQSWRVSSDKNFPKIDLDIGVVIVGSVVPSLDQKISDFCQDSFDCKAVFVTHENAGINIKLDRAEESGADRLINAVAVKHYYSAPAVVVDFGTATTFDVVDRAGAFCGGAIAPGPNLSMQALQMAATKLPEVEIARPETVIGSNTVHAMQSGLYWGYVGLIEGMLNRIAVELNEKPFVVATGGLAHLFAEDISMIDCVDQELTLKGLLQIYKHL